MGDIQGRVERSKPPNQVAYFKLCSGVAFLIPRRWYLCVSVSYLCYSNKKAIKFDVGYREYFPTLEM